MYKKKQVKGEDFSANILESSMMVKFSFGRSIGKPESFHVDKNGKLFMYQQFAGSYKIYSLQPRSMFLYIPLSNKANNMIINYGLYTIDC